MRFIAVFFVSIALFALVIFVLRLLPHKPLKDFVRYSRTVSASNGHLLRVTLADDDHYRLWRALDAISPAMVDAVLLKEDRYFYYHPGINPASMLRAVQETYFGGARQGASTITMQLARRLYNINSRSLGGKIRQITAAFWLELRYSKHEILEAYLNFAPMGGNIEGVEAAAQVYFHKSAQNLSLGEAMALAVIPQSPAKRARFDKALQKSRQRLVNEWREEYSDDPRTKSLIDLPVGAFERADMPFFAPHYSDMTLARYSEQDLRGTLDFDLQIAIERIVTHYVRERHRAGIRNAAVLLVDTRDMGVKAMVGSADFYDKKIHGQVNGVTSRRSPGSTIKPFLYALAIDQGIIHPMTILKDTPSMFGNFQPENFDGRFVGPLSAQDALIRSRNVPAVWLASQTRNPTLYQFLKDAGVTGLRPEESYGLSIALGGGEIRMTELASLYALLARDGWQRSLRFLENETSILGPQLFTTAAAFITRDILYHHARPDGLPPDRRGKEWKVAWKTGTSWSYHDAWTTGIVGPYVLIVWIGNFDNTGPTAFIGVRSAAPLFFRIADALPTLKANVHPKPDVAPSNVKQVDICIASGDLPDQWCPATRKAWFIPGVSPIRVSSLHRPVIIDIKTGKAACPPYDSASTRQEIYEFWPSDLQQLFAAAGLPRRKPPVAECSGTFVDTGGIAPQIRYPVLNVTYLLKRTKENQTIRLQANASSGVKKLYWFQGQSLIGASEPGGTLEWRPMRSGRYHLRVADDHGRSSIRTVEVDISP